MIDNRFNIIYIHIDKCAGTAICNHFKSWKGRHSDWRYYKHWWPEYWESFYKFSFVRNPWDRIVSSWHWHIHHSKCEYYNNKHDLESTLKRAKEKEIKFRHKFPTFQRCIELLPRYFTNTRNTKFNPYYKYICDDDLNIMVDFVGKVENLNEDFNHIQKTLYLKETPLKPANKLSDMRKHHYSAYYSDEMADFVANLYKIDIELFDYKFERKEEFIPELVETDYRSF